MGRPHGSRSGAGRTRGGGVVRVAASRTALATLLCLVLSAPQAAAAELDPRFEERTLASRLNSPAAVAWAPDGRLFIAERAGVVKVVRPGREPFAETLIDISDHVNNYGDRGLLGIAVDSRFRRNGYLYLLYTYETDPLHQDGPKTSRLTRIVVRRDNTVRRPKKPERVLLGREGERPCQQPDNERDCIPSDATYHSIGTVRAARDGTLWLGSGDSADAYSVNSHAFRAYREDSFAGKLIRVDRRGRGLPSHPFCPGDDDLDHVCTKLYAKGFRNPFRFTLRGRGKGPLVGDVGLATRDEIDLASAGASYGWPCHEGSVRTPGYEDHPACAPVYRAGGQQGPIFELRGPGATIVLGPRLSGRTYPSGFRRRFFAADYVRRVIFPLRAATGGTLAADPPIASGVSAVDLAQAPNGNLSYVDIEQGVVREIAHAPGNRRPVPAMAASRTSGRLPLEVDFDAGASLDPEGGRLSYGWRFGDGERARGRRVSHVFRKRREYVVTLTVRDARGRSAREGLRISAGNTPPRLTVLRPRTGTKYRAGERIGLRAKASDREDGRLKGAAISWRVVLRHDRHHHALLSDLEGGRTTFATSTDHDADSLYRVFVAATDSDGLSKVRQIVLRPATIGFGIDSDPPGAPVTYGGAARTAPFSTRSAVGFETSVSAAERFSRGGRSYVFAGWADGAPRLRELTVPAQDARLMARYREAP